MVRHRNQWNFSTVDPPIPAVYEKEKKPRLSPKQMAICATVFVCLLLLALFINLAVAFSDNPPITIPVNDDVGTSQTLDTWLNVALDTSAIDHTPVSAHALNAWARSSSHEQSGPVRTARAMAIVCAALSNVVAASEKSTLEPYRVGSGSPSTTKVDLRAALATAGHDVLVALYPAQTARLDSLLANFTAKEMPRTPRRGALFSAGQAFGRDIAASILLDRADDGSDHDDPPVDAFTEKGVPGKWDNDPVAPTRTALGALWAQRVRPFVIPSADAFRSPPPPALDSIEYAMEYYEVRSLGGNDTTNGDCIRDEWREFVGVFWAYDGTSGICAPARLYLKIVQGIATEEGMTLQERARLYGLVGLVLGDAALAAWDSKFHWRRERPVTAVRETAARDGNQGTVVDPSWVPLGAPDTNGDGPNFTPPFPAYPSGHAVFGSAVFHMVRLVLGGRDEIALPFVSDEFDGRVRPRRQRMFGLLSEMEEENGQSRIYLGIHWASDKTAGIEQGRAVAEHVFAHAYKPTETPPEQ